MDVDDGWRKTWMNGWMEGGDMDGWRKTWLDGRRHGWRHGGKNG